MSLTTYEDLSVNVGTLPLSAHALTLPVLKVGAILRSEVEFRLRGLSVSDLLPGALHQDTLPVTSSKSYMSHC